MDNFLGILQRMGNTISYTNIYVFAVSVLGCINKTDGAVQQGFLDRDSANPEPNQWQAFSDDPSPQKPLKKNAPQSVRTRNGESRKQNVLATSVDEKWGFETDSFTAVPSSSSQIPKTAEKRQPWDFNKGETKAASQPAGWAGF